MESELWYRVKSLEQFMNIKWVKCDNKDCYEGINITTYAYKSPCDKCDGVGKTHKEI